MKLDHLLVIKLSSIGDTIHAVPAVAAIHERFPGCRITWCVERPCSQLIARLPLLDELILVETRAWRRLKHLAGERGPLACLRRLRRQRFDAAIDFQGLLKSAAITALARADQRIGWSRPHLREPLAAAFYDTRVAPGPETVHVIDWCAALARPLGIERIERRFPFQIPAEADRKVEAALQPTAGRPIAVINPGAGWPTKLWPAERFGELSARLAAELDLSVVVTTGPGEKDLLARIRQWRGSFISLDLDLVELAALARRTACFIGGDTGPTFVASAMGAPVVALYGPSDPRRNGPFQDDDVVLCRQLPCSGCYRRKCPESEHQCMDFSVGEVFEAVRLRLERARTKHGH